MHWHVLSMKVSHRAVLGDGWNGVLCAVSFSLWGAGWDRILQRLRAVEGLRSAGSVHSICVLCASHLFLFFPLFFFGFCSEGHWVTEGWAQGTLNQVRDKGSMRGVPRFIPCVGSYSVTGYSSGRSWISAVPSCRRKWTPLKNWKYTWGKDHNFVTIRAYFNVRKCMFHALIGQHYFYTQGF